MGNEETFGDRLRKKLEEVGMSQAALGKGLKAAKNGVLGEDLGRAAVFGWLSGTGFPNAVQLAAICRKLNISADYLLFGGITAAPSPQMERAAEAVRELSDEERLALFTVMQGPAFSDAQVETKSPITRTLKKEKSK